MLVYRCLQRVTPLRRLAQATSPLRRIGCVTAIIMRNATTAENFGEDLWLGGW